MTRTRIADRDYLFLYPMTFTLSVGTQIKCMRVVVTATRSVHFAYLYTHLESSSLAEQRGLNIGCKQGEEDSRLSTLQVLPMMLNCLVWWRGCSV